MGEAYREALQGGPNPRTQLGSLVRRRTYAFNGAALPGLRPTTEGASNRVLR